MTFYAYVWLREDWTPYYVGKGSGSRAFQSDGHIVKRPKDRRRIKIYPCASEQEAFDLEKSLIVGCGRKNNGTGILRNLTDGGEGASGTILSEETRRKISAALMGNQRTKGYIPSVEHRQKVSIALLGIKRKPVSEETREKIRKKLSGRKAWPNGRLPYSEEHRRKMSLAALGRIPWNKGKKMSEEVCQKNREAQLRRIRTNVIAA